MITDKTSWQLCNEHITFEVFVSVDYIKSTNEGFNKPAKLVVTEIKCTVKPELTTISE